MSRIVSAAASTSARVAAIVGLTILTTLNLGPKAAIACSPQYLYLVDCLFPEGVSLTPVNQPLVLPEGYVLSSGVFGIGTFYTYSCNPIFSTFAVGYDSPCGPNDRTFVSVNGGVAQEFHGSTIGLQLAMNPLFGVATTVCGDGIAAGAEGCDDGNLVDGDCCSSTCHPDTGTPCNDHDACTRNDNCTSAGTCVGTDPLDCDDGDACSADSCNPLTGCVHDDAAATGCLTANKALLLVKEGAGDHANDKLAWKWSRDAVDQVDFADPTSSDGYALCLYAGTTAAPLSRAALPPGTGWSATGVQRYKFKGTSPDGLSLALLKGGGAGKAKALVKGKGTTLPDPPLPLPYPVTMQLKKDGSPLCLESSFTAADEVKNDAGQFKAKK